MFVTADTLQWAMYSVDWENTRRYVSAWERSCGSCAAFDIQHNLDSDQGSTKDIDGARPGWQHAA